MVDRDRVQIEYCPTRLMLADFFTKRLQGELFSKFKAVVLGHKPIESLFPTSSESKECAEANK